MNFLNMLIQKFFSRKIDDDVRQNPPPTSSRAEQVRLQLQNCTYVNEKKPLIEKDIGQVLQIYPFFDTKFLSYPSKGQNFCFIQVKGILEIYQMGQACKVDFNVMVPIEYPDIPPFVRIVNHNPDYIIDPIYAGLKSKTDPSSYVLNDILESVQKWKYNPSIVNIIIESKTMLSNTFPFYRPKVNNSNSNSLFKSREQLQNAQQDLNQAWNINPNQGWNEFFNSATNSQNPNAQPIINQQMKPVNQCAIASSNKVIGVAQKHIEESRETLKKLKVDEIRVLDKIQSFQIISRSLTSETKHLSNQIFAIKNFIYKNSRSSQIKISSILQPADERSKQLLDMLASIKAREECLFLLESKFAEGETGFLNFLKIVHKMESDNFLQKLLCKKCLLNC